MSQTQRLGTTATTVATSDGITRVTYNSTVVVAFDAKTVTLNSGGWRTNTTKTRMNQASNQFGLGYRVYQDRGDWLVTLPSGKDATFADGMNIKR